MHDEPNTNETDTCTIRNSGLTFDLLDLEAESVLPLHHSHWISQKARPTPSLAGVVTSASAIAAASPSGLGEIVPDVAPLVIEIHPSFTIFTYTVQTVPITNYEHSKITRYKIEFGYKRHINADGVVLLVTHGECGHHWRPLRLVGQHALYVQEH